MEIISNPLTPASTDAITRLDAVTGINPLIPTTSTTAVDLTPLSSTTVDLSPLGQFLSSLSLSRKTLTQLQGAAATANDSTDTNHAEAVATAAQQLASAFNVLQTNATAAPPVGTAQSSIDGLPGDAADTPLTQAQAQASAQAQPQPLQAPAVGADAASNLDTLAQFGITLQTSPLPANNNTLVVDEQALQAAFAANPAGTVASLNQAADALYAYGANLLQQTANAVTQSNSIDVLDSETAQALQQAAAVRDTFAADNANQPTQQTSAAGPAATETTEAVATGAAAQAQPPLSGEAPAGLPQTTLADMALTDLLGETQQATQAADAASTAQQLQATTLAATAAAEQEAATTAAANTALIKQAAATQAAATQSDLTQAERTQADLAQATATQAASLQTAADQQQADTALATEQAASAAAANQQANNAAAATTEAQAAIDAGNARQAVQQADAAASNNALQANAETGVEQANRLARDPAIAAAIAAYHLNDGPLHADTAEQELAVLSQRQAVAPVAPVTRVDPAEKV